MKNIAPYAIMLLLVLFSSCIKEDIIDDFQETDLRITNPLLSLAIGNSHQYETQYLDNVGIRDTTELQWTSSEPSVATVDASGLVTALKGGTTFITVSTVTATEPRTATTALNVAEETVIDNPIRKGSIIGVQGYEGFKGNFTLEDDLENNKLLLKFDNIYQAPSGLPGLYIYLTNNVNGTLDDSYKIGRVTTFAGAHTYEISNEDVNLFDYKYVLYWCKPVGITIAEGKIN